MQIEHKQSAGALYRSGITAADVLAAPGALTTSVVAGGSLVDGQTYRSKVVAVNPYGRTTATAGTNRAASDPSLALRIAFAAVTGATHYDIYVSTDADPLWVGRITEAQRASGILITAVGTTGAGSIAGAVDVQVAGTGLAAGVTAVVNTAYNAPTSADPISLVTTKGEGYRYIDFDLAMSRTGDAVAPALVVTPWLKNSSDGLWYAGTPVTLTFGGATGVFLPLYQTTRIEARGAAAVALLVQSIAGTGASLDIRYRLS